MLLAEMLVEDFLACVPGALRRIRCGHTDGQELCRGPTARSAALLLREVAARIRHSLIVTRTLQAVNA
jgi:hypothetical protein